MAEHIALLPSVDRVAFFDNDGTLWCEWPSYPADEGGDEPAAVQPLAKRRDI
jgi:hypothetical protein